MMRLTDPTHDPARRSWVASANVAGGDFPVQNLPLGRFRRADSSEAFRGGVAIGGQVLDLALAAGVAGWPEGAEAWFAPLAEGDLNAFAALGPAAWKGLRAALSDALTEGSPMQLSLSGCLLPMERVEMALPMRIGDYSDFFTGIHHARAAGALFRPDTPLLPNYQWVPIGYHGRASSIGLGGEIVRPNGQRKGSADTPTFGPSQRLDHELELGLFVGRANPLGRPVPMAEAESALFGITLLNDWSARDLQAWEYQPLGPFLAKSFATSISPWVVSFEALAPFRRPFTRPEGDPAPLPYLDSAFNREHGAVHMQLEAWIQTRAMREAGLPAVRLSHSNLTDAYWTPAQLVAHHTSNGCNLNVGDLLGTGTISGPNPGQGGCLLELTTGGRAPITLPNGETRAFLEDGDTVTLTAFCEAPGAVRIGLGHVSGTVRAAG
jgi:fumarylacetoacetase